MSRQLDIVLFGASGFTGTYCIESLHKLTKSNGNNITWGIAGRSEKKLQEALQECATEIGEDLSSVSIILADVHDFDSLKRMAARARVIINCCGPYVRYGELVVKACIETGTHQVDVAAEVYYMEKIFYDYHKAAEERGVYIVSACGFVSIPLDLGILYLQDKFEGTINSVESYMEYFRSGKGPSANYSSCESLLRGITSKNELHQLRQKLYPTPLHQFQPQLKVRSVIHKSNFMNKWCFRFKDDDRSVIERTQRYFFNSRKYRPIQFQSYLVLESIFVLIFMAIFGSIFILLAKCKWGRYLILKYPTFFTAGIIGKERPCKSSESTSKFATTLLVDGWDEKLPNVADPFKTPPNKKMVARFSGIAPAYTLTGKLATLSAITIINERDKLPKGGGVYTPGIAFRKTSLMKLAQENGLKVEIL